MKRFWRGWMWVVPFAVLAALGLWFFLDVARDLPDPATLPARLDSPSMRITDREGRLLYEVFPQTGGRHSVVPLSEIPMALRQATLATEDSHFYQNPGVDLGGIVRAVWINLRGGEAISGGSTITQQVARSLLLTPAERTERSLRRKLRESLLAWLLARRYSKDEILAFYLNQTYYGGMAYGVEAASQTFFGRPVSGLDLAESALLAGLPQSPAGYNPFSSPAAAKQRQAVVLGLMGKQGMITADERALAEAEPLVFSDAPYPLEAPHFIMLVRGQLEALVSEADVYRHGGVEVRTTLNLDWQRRAEDAVREQLARLKEEGQKSLSHNVNNAALVALDPRTGQILAMVGSPDYGDAEHAGEVNMALAPRQPGSALKPLIYAAAFDPAQPAPWTAGTMLLDVTTSFVTHDGLSYTPANYDNLEHGPVLARDALGSSLNIPAVLTLDHIHLPALFGLASRLGITTLNDPDRYDLSLALGGGEVSLLQLTAAYAALDHHGVRVEPYAIAEIRGMDDALLYQARPAAEVQVIDPRVAWLISDILSDDAARSTGFGRSSLLRIDRPAAVKTGTTTNFHDNWTIGYTPEVVVGVWAGNASHESMRQVTGLTGAAPIWHQFIRTVLEGRPAQPFERPQGLRQVEICSLSGLLPTPACPYRRFEWFIEGTQPTRKDTFYRTVDVDALTGRLATSATPPGQVSRQLALDLPPQALPWARANHLLLLTDLNASAVSAQSGAALQVISPPDQAIYHFSASASAESQQLQIRLTAAPGLAQVQIWLDGHLLAAFPSQPYQAWWQLVPGTHELWAEATADDGSQLESPRVHFTVK